MTGFKQKFKYRLSLLDQMQRDLNMGNEIYTFKIKVKYGRFAIPILYMFHTNVQFSNVRRQENAF